jgi:DNA polymerase-3 subunit gamma/tau
MSLNEKGTSSMSYQVLARKWRPHSFKDMVGQKPILRMLANALEQQRLHHAYLFTGTRGVGKTTIARILAKSLNCDKGVTSTPCGECNTCQSIDSGTFLDLYEIDAASRTKVEDTRDLLENVPYPPTQGRYKVYLIDEVHMLSNHSFNALLKTLEEPPEHVKFLLATTDPKKLPVTILSRCLQFHLKRIAPEQISQHLQHILETEKIQHDQEALEKIAKGADGSMRDALSLLDQAIAYGNGSVNKADVDNMLGCLSHDDIMPIVNALIRHDGVELFARIKELVERGPDFQQVLEELIGAFHQAAIMQIVPDAVTDKDIQSIARAISPEDLQLYYQIALLGRRDLAYSPTPRLGFEMTLLRMLAFQPGATATITATDTVAAAPQQKKVKPVPIKETSAAPTHNAMTDTLQDWRAMLPKLELAGMAYALAANCILENVKENKVTLALSANHQPMLNPKLRERIEEALTRYFKQPMQLEIVIGAKDIVTPQKLDLDEQNERLNQAKQTVMQNPKVQKLVAMYDATVDVSIQN